jgi:mono/diheme cytochrome c family protein/glucose/arabinose dehydrogenase
MRPRFILLTLGAAACAFAQMGDALDKAGEKQVSLVPREKIPPAPVLSPADALQAFQLAPGLRIELVASEPLVEDPVAITFGPDGRMWVVEMRGYMPDFEGHDEDAPSGRIVVLSDEDGDGRYDRRTVFLDGLVLPRAIALVRDGALIGAPPFLKYWRDTNGDGRADAEETIATDFGTATDPKRPELANPERAPNALHWALDNWIYAAAYTKKFRFAGGHWESAPTTFRGQWGLSEDDFGHLFHNSNSDQLRADIIPSHYLGRNPNYPRAAGTNVLVPANQLVWPARVTPGTNRAYRPETMREGKLKEFTAACAPWIYRGDALPAEFQGNAFVCEPAANLVKRNLITAAHGTLTSREAYDQKEFLASTDERFRPVNLATGPDGALYLVDLHKGVIEHRVSLTTYLRKQAEDRGLVAPLHLGRIYRILPADSPAPRPARLDQLMPAALVAELSQSNSWRRETAQRLLIERGDRSVIPALLEVALQGTQPTGRLYALCTLDGLAALDAGLLVAALRDSAPMVRAAAIRLCEPLLATRARGTVLPALLAAASDNAPEVRLQLLLTLGEARDPDVDITMARLARAASEDAFVRDALCSGLYGRELTLLEKLLADPTWAATDATANNILGDLARGILNSRDAELVRRLLDRLAALPAEQIDRRLALLNGATSATLATAARPIGLPREPAALAKLRMLDDAATRAAFAKVDRLLTWPDKPGAVPLFVPPPLTRAEQARFDMGRTLYAGTCLPCHQAHGRGLDGLAPPLANSEWVNGSAERVVRIALHGVRGPLRVDGRSYNLDMPPWGALRDDDLAAVLTFVRREWGNTGTPITAEFVRSQRAATTPHNDAWTQTELLKVP